MGRANKQRRAEKRRRDQRRAGGWSHGHDPGSATWTPIDDPTFLASAGVMAAATGAAPVVTEVVDRLAALARRRGVAEIGGRVCEHAEEVLAAVWEDGWMPAEAPWIVGRRRSPRHADLVVTALAATERWQQPGTVPPGPWTAQLDELGVERWWGPSGDWLTSWAAREGVSWSEAVTTLLDALAVLSLLPPLEPVVPPPSRWGSGAGWVAHPAGDEATLAKIRALLAKAESTSFDAEAEALTAKAQELMSRHAIDEAVARSASDTQERPSLRRVRIDNPYADAKGALLDVVAGSNGVRSIAYTDLGLVAIVGFESDLDSVELLFTSLLVQATRSMVAKGRTTDGRGRSRTRSFRQSFLVAYAQRVGERLHLASVAARTEAESATGRDLLPVLARRDDEVEDEVARRFPHLVTRRGPKVTNQDGWFSGRAAAELATLGPVQGVLVSSP